MNIFRLVFGPVFIAMLLCKPGLAQMPLLSSEAAVRLALQSNFDIQISKADAQIAQLNNTKGNAGMLPTVNLVANENFTLSAFQQKLANGSEFKAAGAPFNSANAGVQLAWTLFDGRRMHIVKHRLEASAALGQLNLQSAIQSTTASVLQVYYDIVRGKLQELAIQELIQLNEARLQMAESRLAAGFAAQTDALQARIDLNQRRADLLQQQSLTNSLKRNLNRLIGQRPDTEFDVDISMESNYSPEPNGLLEKVLAQNPTMASFQKSAEIAALLVDENHSLGKARLVGLGQFNASRSDNGTGFTLNNTQAGVTVGASLVVPLYTGGNVKRQVETAKLGAQKALLDLENQGQLIALAVENHLDALKVQQQILTIETDNVAISRENLSVITERFRVGTTTGLELQNAQNALEQALIRKNLVLYNLKIAELQLKFLAGEL